MDQSLERKFRNDGITGRVIDSSLAYPDILFFHADRSSILEEYDINHKIVDVVIKLDSVSKSKVKSALLVEIKTSEGFNQSFGMVIYSMNISGRDIIKGEIGG